MNELINICYECAQKIGRGEMFWVQGWGHSEICHFCHERAPATKVYKEIAEAEMKAAIEKADTDGKQ